MARSLPRLLVKVGACVLLAAMLACGLAVALSSDREYTAYEIAFYPRFHRYDALIKEIALKQAIDPALIKAVIWRESRFRPDKVGLDGERGLMQLTEAAAAEWVKATKAEPFFGDEMFDPRRNIEVGSWLLARALKRYQDRDDPLPFALAEYNAGRTRVKRWTEKSPAEPESNSHQLQANIDIPSTRNYVASVRERVEFYHRRDRL